MSHPCISYVNYYYCYGCCYRHNDNNDNNDDDDDNNNFSYAGCLSTTRRHSQIRKKDYDPSIFTCLSHTIDVLRIESLVPPNVHVLR